MKCIIIDDEPLAIDVIDSYCNAVGSLEVIGKFTSAIEALDFLKERRVDLIFSDIEMPHISGIDFIKSIDSKPMFIFTTAYPKYALDGFDLNAIDYLVKPIPFPRFIKAINRVKDVYITKDLSSNVNTASASGSVKESEDDFIFVKSEYDNVKIKLSGIKYIQGLKDYLKIHTHINRPVLTLMNFKSIQEKLPSNNFMRVHRSFVVNVDYIESVQKNKIIIDDVRIPIAENYKTLVYERLGIK